MTTQGAVAVVLAAPRVSTRRPPTAYKWGRVLLRLLQPKPLNRFEAEQPPIADHTLNSTISTLELKGLTIARRTVRLHGYCGQGVDCCEYWLEADQKELARELLRPR